MMVNGALEVEKQLAENKFEKLAEAVRKLDEIGAFRDGELVLDENVKLGLELASVKLPIGKKTESCEAYNHQISGSPDITTPVKDCMSGRNRDDLSSRRRVSKMLVFEDDGSKSTNVDDLSDNETEERNKKESDGMDALEERSIGENYEDDDVEACEVNTSTPRKRKRVVTSDSENDDDDDEDNIPISILKNLKPPNEEMSDLVDTPSIEENESGGLRSQRRVSSRLRKKRVLEEISTSSERNLRERLVGIPTTGNAEDDETEEESELESESLNGFIVDDESASEKTDETEGDVREEVSDGETGYAEIMSRLRRDKKPGKRKWEYLTDMQADFGKDPELCMRAVCALYRLQTEEEKAARSSYVANGRGFSKFDAERGCRIGHFLTDGDPVGDLKKSVEELRSFEPGAVEICEHLAGRYSKQLFGIYNNREDPFFAAPPSP
ncbi:uncharacterized protein LOC18017871 isoform X2 [Eutrema salsugineum]|nr:uncharacterized protein LOC18017871 isoform X2 [Eutrema salsugineum]